MTQEIFKPSEPDELTRAYQLAMAEFNLAAMPLILALSARVVPSPAAIMREESARAQVVDARQKVWASYAERAR
jgi:hypothetical protein